MTRLLLPLLLLNACSAEASQIDDSPIQQTGTVEEYGFVATLGYDTVSVERISRSDNAIISDAVERFPIVRLRHSELEIGSDGKLTRMMMDVRTPSGTTPDELARKVFATFTDDSVHVTIEQSSGTTGRSFPTAGMVMVPHASMLYSVIEYEMAAVLKRAASAGVGDTLQFLQFYPDRDVGRRFVVNRGRVMPQGDGRVELRHGWLAGAGDAVFDDEWQMQSYSGERSTYKVAVERLTELPDIEAIGAAFAATEEATGAAQLSVRDTTRASIGEASFLIDYGRPLTRGRELLGNLVPFDRVWRTGANAATQFTTSEPLTIAGLEVPAGSYTLWTIPRVDGAELIVNNQTGQWGTGYRRNADLGRSPMQTETVTAPMEKFTISIEESDATHGTLVLEWGTFRWTAGIEVR